MIEKASGVIQPTYTDDVTHVICLHQQSATFKKALQDKKLIATAYWLNDVLVAKKFFPPRTPLHLPVPFTGKFSSTVINCFSHIHGSQRNMSVFGVFWDIMLCCEGCSVTELLISRFFLA